MSLLFLHFLTILTIYFQIVLCEHDNRLITTLKYSKYKVTPTVINGKRAGEGQFPYLVSIKEGLYKLEPGKTRWSNLCGGSIIGMKKVLTAAHCFESDNFYYEKYPEKLRIVAGNMQTELIHDGKTETTPNGQWRTVKQALLHKHFNFPDNDIAIALVDQPWVFNNRVNYVRLATLPADYEGQCVAAGYGRLGDEPTAKTSEVLLTADIDTITRMRCSLLWELNMNSFVCTKTAVTDVARGDSGGPLLCRRTGDPAETNEEEGILVGVVSGKNYDMTTLFTRVSAFKDWISKPVIRSQSSAGTKQASVNVGLCIIILVVLLYFLFYCSVSVLRKITVIVSGSIRFIARSESMVSNHKYSCYHFYYGLD